MEYDILEADSIVGKVTVVKEGLYYSVSCRLTPGVENKRIYLHNGRRFICLGSCVPIGDTFGFDTKISVKQAGEGQLDFTVEPKKERLISVLENEPFEDMHAIMRCRTTIVGDQLFLSVKETGQ